MEHFDWMRSFLFPYVNFAIFLVVLVYFGRKPMQALASKKREEYDSLYQSARAAQKAAEEKLQQLNARMEHLEAEIGEIRSKAEKEAESEAKQIVERGKELAEHIRTEAVRIAEGEISRSRLVLQEEILLAVTKEVESKVRTEFVGEKQLGYIREKATNLKQIVSHNVAK